MDAKRIGAGILLAALVFGFMVITGGCASVFERVENVKSTVMQLDYEPIEIIGPDPLTAYFVCPRYYGATYYITAKKPNGSLIHLIYCSGAPVRPPFLTVDSRQQETK